MRFGKEGLVLLLLLSAFLTAAGCVPKSYRAHPDLALHLKDIKTHGLVPPDIKVYEFTAGGVHELRDDWCDIGRQNTAKAVAEELKERSMGVKAIPVDKEIETELEEIQALYRAVSLSIQWHTYGPFLFPEKQKNFDYSLGPVKHLLQKNGADTLLFIDGFDEISTGGRKALIVVGLLTGIVPRSGVTAMSSAVVDAEGKILWYNVKGSQAQHDLRNYDSVCRLVDSLLADLPKAGSGR